MHDHHMHARPMSGDSSGLSAFVLAGGKSTRMGADKAFVVLDGRTLLDRMLELARSITSDVRIVGGSGKFASFAPVVEDTFAGCGPLGGIHAALRASRSELNLIVAVDVPFVTPALLQLLIKRSRNSTAIATVPRAGGGWQPLCAVYRRDFANPAEKALRAGRYKIDALFSDVPIEAISESELEAGGIPASVFRNLNTPEELAKAKGATGELQRSFAATTSAQDDNGPGH